MPWRVPCSICKESLINRAWFLSLARKLFDERPTDAALVAAMITLLPKEKQEFFRLRYQKKLPLVFVAPKLFISPKVAGVWNAEILERLYALREGVVGDFILSPPALCAVESYLNTILDFYLTEGMKYADPIYIRKLETRRDSLVQLRLYMEQYLENVNAQERQLLLCWCYDPCLTYVELAGRFYVSESTAGRYVLRFKGVMFIFGETLSKKMPDKGVTDFSALLYAQENR
ncbi:hypothetical protein SATMO3_19020 [Sporomusa aerivorans]